jgi:hypothetical protein
LGAWLSDATDFRVIVLFWAIDEEVEAIEERVEVFDATLFAFRFEGSMGGTGGRFVLAVDDAVEAADCRD